MLGYVPSGHKGGMIIVFVVGSNVLGNPGGLCWCWSSCWCVWAFVLALLGVGVYFSALELVCWCCFGVV